ncbi:pathway-specific nitrogen regulator [Plectosphaerella plurivora]|uniref:Pathway-specific nitrogen regulator n=1 Tax=Plectosphaerella plurivora TaxID=936078 RepID=A0A9P8V6M9_9PEZI|nr:pathway-specific nitrogen regulator [Plectosphaerella plurivora]
MSTAPPPKPIRFVHNQGQPPSKRRRINAACLTCRKRKTRCAGERPICSTCKKNGHECLGYTDIPDKRPTEGNAADRPRSAYDDLPDEDVDEEEEEVLPDPVPGKNQLLRLASSQRPATSGNLSPVPPSQPWRPGFPSQRSKSNESVPRTLPPRRISDHEPDRPRPAPPAFPQPLSPEEGRGSLSPTLHFKDKLESHRVPYFRYFGPTAIVPGYKQMVVSVRERRRSNNGSASATSPSSSGHGPGHMQSLAGAASAESDVAAIEDLPVYDLTEGVPVPPLILHLVKLFFTHLGCNYPFLKEARFTRMVQEKRVEPILVDAVCALAARFSDAPQIVQGGKIPRSEYGNQYAQRAKAATVDTFPAPSVGAVQALLMMAYEGFGANQDSALWMYLGLAIRMAVDLGLQKVVGIKYQGEKDPWYVRHWAGGSSSEAGGGQSEHAVEDDGVSRAQEVEVEQERMNTFWAVFVLDRVISSGTGRPVTFRDDDFEFGLPEVTIDPGTGWPDPFPTFVRIIHLYGRASDLLNNIRGTRDLTRDKWAELAQMEGELTRLYQTQDPRLHFNVGSFKAYLSIGQSTTFILMHFWFHALIIILHQPTLLTPFGSLSRTHQLLPNSRELSMSSAKTIADILSFAELIGPTSFIGNPFTSQPMYIAACAFLMESAAMASQPASREHSPTGRGAGGRQGRAPGEGTGKTSSKHSLLASAANQNYSRCYNSLQQLHAYWGGVKYILTALDQKSKGIWDCETYTNEEYESTKTPSDRRASFINAASGAEAGSNQASPNIPPFAWSLTGATNSPNSSLTVMYQNMQKGGTSQAAGHASRQFTGPGGMAYYAPRPVQHDHHQPMYPPGFPPQSSVPQPSGRRQQLDNGPDVRAGTHQPYTPLNQDTASASPPLRRTYSGASPMNMAPPQQQQHPALPSPSYPTSYEGFSAPTPMAGETPGSTHSVPVAMGAGLYDPSGYGGGFSYGMDQGMGPIGDVVTYENPIDLGSLGLTNDMMPQWLDYLPSDVLGMFESGGGSMNEDGGGGS